MNKRNGFTILELLIFVAIFSVIIVAFVTMFLSILRVNSRQVGVAEVNRQSQFLLQSLQYRIERSSLIEMPTDVSTTTIRLRTTATSTDPTLIYLSGGVVYLQEGNSAAEPLTNDKVVVSSASFVKRNNSPGKDSLNISFTMEYATNNIQQEFAQSLDTAIARVSAASFDSDIVASSSNTYSLGTSQTNWRSINSTIYFSGANVGIGVSGPTAKLQINSGDVYVDTVAKGIVLRSPDGNCWRVTVTNAGAMSTAGIACP